MTLDDLVTRVTDPYERQARLYPALLALLPVLVMITLLYGPIASALTSAVIIAVSCGGLYLTTNLCRELGKRLEIKLFQEWGGKPTTRLLRHRDRTIEEVTKRRYHLFLAAKINEAFPNKDQEAKNPGAADEIYQSGVRWLLNHTRLDDNTKFDLLFKENVAYSFRRNALGMKPIGLILSIGTFIWTLKREDILFGSTRNLIDVAAFGRVSEAAATSLIVSVVMIAVWIFFFTRANLRNSAFTYAETLLRACDTL